jgi:hypothetical protein
MASTSFSTPMILFSVNRFHFITRPRWGGLYLAAGLNEGVRSE